LGIGRRRAAEEVLIDFGPGPHDAPSPLTPIKTRLELIAATRRFAKDDPRKSWWCVLSSFFLLCAALLGTLWNFNLAARAASSVLAGLLMMRFFVIYHDQQHHAILSRSKLAERLMQVFGILALTPSSVWRSSHNHHHKHNSKLRGSDIGSFPIMTKDQYRKSPRSERRSYLFVRHPLTILFGYVFMFLFGMCLNPFLHYPRRHFDCLVALLVHAGLAVALVLLGGWTALVLTLLIPFFITYAVATYFFYAQHNFPGVSFSDQGGWTYEKAAMESSSFMRAGPIVRWFTANISYHHIHHLNARIPFYRLPEVIRALPELQNPKTTSLRPADILRCLRLKVWDVEAQRMVGVQNL
jgi:omega-6 fatty acid desaturase (delta-12 desaturase)